MAKAKRKRAAPVRVDENQRYTMPEAAAILRQSVAKTYLDVKRGDLRVLKDGARTYAPGSELIRRSTLPADLTSAAPSA